MDTPFNNAAALRPIHYDAVRRRLWICGQRCHHGATGALLTAVGAVGTLASLRPLRQLKPLSSVALLATGTLLMAHDWKDRPIWFQRGWQDQP
jgi:hypothetical protein